MINRTNDGGEWVDDARSAIFAAARDMAVRLYVAVLDVVQFDAWE